MKVSDFYPIFYTEDLDTGIKLFTENLGFKLKHRPDLEQLEYAVLQNDNGSRVDLVRSHFPADSFNEGYLGMRVNVDNFDEGVSLFEGQGYSVFGTAHDTPSSITALMKNDNNEYIVIFHHKK